MTRARHAIDRFCPAWPAWLAVAVILAPFAVAQGRERGQRGETPPLVTVPDVDLGRYMGVWYEVSRYPNTFQKGLVGVTAEYRLQRNGKIAVTNRGFKEALDGPVKQSRATGWLAKPEDSTIWKVQFFWPFKADYWIIDLCSDYQFAVVGQPSRKYLWVLSRTPSLPDEVYRKILNRLEKKGYDSSRLVRTQQPAVSDAEQST